MLIGADGSGRRLIDEAKPNAGDSSRHPVLPRWSADGTKVLYGERYWEGSGPLNIYDVATAAKQQVARDGGIILFHWALSGKAFLAGQGSYGDLYSDRAKLFEPGTDKPIALTDGPVESRPLAVSPDGHLGLLSLELVQWGRNTPGEPVGWPSLWTIDLTSRRLALLAMPDQSGPDWLLGGAPVAWSDDGTIYFGVVTPGPKTRLVGLKIK